MIKGVDQSAKLPQIGRNGILLEVGPPTHLKPEANKVLKLFKRLQCKMHKPSIWIFLIADIVLIIITAAIGILVMNGAMDEIPDILNVGRDWSIAEIFGYFKWGVIITAFLVSFRRSGDAIFAWLSVVFFFILADDSLQIHEKMADIGPKIFNSNALVFYALGEMLFLTILGTLCLGVLLISWPKTRPAIKTDLWPLAALFSGVVFCGIGVDFLHVFTPDSSWIAGVLLIVEDGGEMVFTSLMASYCVGAFGIDPKQQQTCNQDQTVLSDV